MKQIQPEVAADVVKQWRASPELRAEFGDDVLRFAAYKNAESQGLVRAARAAVVDGKEVRAKASAGDGGIAKPKKDGNKAKKGKRNV
jgi:hypothetical protein